MPHAMTDEEAERKAELRKCRTLLNTLERTRRHTTPLEVWTDLIAMAWPGCYHRCTNPHAYYDPPLPSEPIREVDQEARAEKLAQRDDAGRGFYHPDDWRLRAELLDGCSPEGEKGHRDGGRVKCQKRMKTARWRIDLARWEDSRDDLIHRLREVTRKHMRGWEERQGELVQEIEAWMKSRPAEGPSTWDKVQGILAVQMPGYEARRDELVRLRLEAEERSGAA